MDELTIGDKIYISSKRAAAITGYAKDYVGQLCREGHVEAKMVGRSWYVLESSIRAHRFGKPELPAGEPAQVEARDAGVPTPGFSQSMPKTDQQSEQGAAQDGWPETWEAPKYVSEEVPTMPELMPSPVVSDQRETPQSLDISEDRQSITEMQTAWKEWFENKQEPTQEPVVEVEQEQPEEVAEEEAPEVVEEEVPVVVHRIPEARPTRVEMPPVRPAQPQVSSERGTVPGSGVVVREKRVRRRSGGPTNLVYTALMIAAGLIVIAVGIIGSGFADTYLGYNPIIEYLGGTSSINKQ